jgi:alkylated DNA repair dioxygenase AlkB
MADQPGNSGGQPGQPPSNLPNLPNLSALTLKPRDQLTRQASDGRYCLDTKDKLDPCQSSVVLQRNALPMLPGEFEQAERFMQEDVRQDTMMGNMVPRKQCTFGPVQYKRYQLVKDESQWPSIVHRVREATRQFAAQLGIPNPEEYTGVHANYYVDGDSKVPKHSDAEKQLVSGAPIFSFTYLVSDNRSLARDFSIWKMPSAGDAVEGTGRKGSLADITLYSGDLLIMTGDMQKYFNHSIEPQTRPVAARLNFTVRKFVSHKEAHARKM